MSVRKRKLDPQPQFIATNKTLKTAVDKWRTNKPAALQQYGKMSTWDTSGVTSMAKLFSPPAGTRTTFTFDNVNDIVSGWDVSNVTDMSYMFVGCKTFNQDLNGWDVSNVISMGSMFENCANFNQDLNNWDVSRVTGMSWMFNACKKFNKPLNNWNVSNVTNMNGMFENCANFNQDISNWRPNLRGVGLTQGYLAGIFDGCTNMNAGYKFTRFLQPVAHVEVNPLQVHQAASKINYEKLNEFLSTRTPQPITRPRNYANYIKNTINTLIIESDADPAKKQELTAGVQSIYEGRLQTLNYNETTSELLRDSIINSLEYVKLQSPVFKQVYVEAFVQDCIHAYDGADGMTCAAGALERIIFSLVPACISANETSETSEKKQEYTTLIILISGPELIINSIMDWHKSHNPKNVGAVAFPKERRPGVDKTKRQADLRQYLLRLYPGLPELIEQLIISHAEELGYEDDDFTRGGKRRNSRKRRKRRINKTRKRQKNKTKKRKIRT
jgi:surface protein